MQKTAQTIWSVWQVSALEIVPLIDEIAFLRSSRRVGALAGSFRREWKMAPAKGMAA